MIKGYKCNWCDKFLEDVEDMEQHEECCDHNPANKTCNTCDNYTWFRGYYDNFLYCKFDHDINHIDDIFDGLIQCKDYENKEVK